MPTVTDELPEEFAERMACVNGLLELADHIAKYPDFPYRQLTNRTFDINTYDKELFAKLSLALAHGGSVDKEITAYTYSATRKFGPLTLRIWSSRGTVCEKVPTGKKKLVARQVEKVSAVYETEMVEEDDYEWVCPDSLHSIAAGTAKG